MKIHIALIVSLFFAAPSVAGWDITEAGTGTQCTELQINPSSPNTCFYNSSSTSAGFLDALDISSCRNAVTLCFDGDTTATTAGAEIYIYQSLSATCSTNTSERLYSDAGAVTLNGNSAVGRHCIYGIMGKWLCPYLSSNSGTDAFRIMAVCH